MGELEKTGGLGIPVVRPGTILAHARRRGGRDFLGDHGEHVVRQEGEDLLSVAGFRGARPRRHELLDRLLVILNAGFRG
jgi:hypothetical protein